MITRLEVDGFKSLRGFSVDLEPFTVLIGPNGAGKSNILEAIGLLHRLREDSGPEVALKGGRGRPSDQFSRYRSSAVSEMTIAAEVLEESDLPRETSVIVLRHVRYELSLIKKETSKAGIVQVELDRRPPRIADKWPEWLDAHPAWTEYVYDTSDLEEHGLSPSFDLVQLQDLNVGEASDRLDAGKLAADGSNLPTVLASLPDSVLADIRIEMAALVPGVSNFEVKEIDDSYRIDFFMRDGDVVPARLISNGTLRLLVLLTALYSQQSWPSIISIEEPENGIYPGRLRRFIELLREVTNPHTLEDAVNPPPQVIVTSHSPVFLAALREHPRHIRYIDTVRRGPCRTTRARPVGTLANAQEGRDKISLAEIAEILESATGREDR
ncbi:MAG TPA: AAA family ATPase [Nannocystis sp.]